MATQMTTVYFQIDGMSCPDCSATIIRVLEQVRGIQDIQIDWESGFAEVYFDPQAIDERRILAHRVFKGKYSARPFTPGCC